MGVLSLSVFFLAPTAAIESFRKPTVDFTAGNGSYLLATSSSPANIHVDAADWPGVLRAAHDLAIDFGRVTNANGTLTATGSATANASMIFNVTGINNDWAAGKNRNNASSTAIIIGTIGNSSLIDDLIASGKLDVSGIEGQWEAYVSVLVQHPLNGSDQALVIAGELCHAITQSFFTEFVQVVIGVVRYTVSMMSLSKLVYLHGTGLLMSLPRATLKYTPSTPRRYKRPRLSSTEVSSSTTRHLH